MIKYIRMTVVIVSSILMIYHVFKEDYLQSLWWMGLIILNKVEGLQENANSSHNTIK